MDKKEIPDHLLEQFGDGAQHVMEKMKEFGLHLVNSSSELGSRIVDDNGQLLKGAKDKLGKFAGQAQEFITSMLSKKQGSAHHKSDADQQKDAKK